MTVPQHIPPDRVAALHAIRDRNPGNIATAQRNRLLDALQTLGYCTTFEASRFLDLYDPRARKMELVKAGHQVVMTWSFSETESGARHRIGLYSLVKGKA